MGKFPEHVNSGHVIASRPVLLDRDGDDTHIGNGLKSRIKKLSGLSSYHDTAIKDVWRNSEDQQDIDIRILIKKS